jgi:iron(III) transport system substrate-binding protein
MKKWVTGFLILIFALTGCAPKNTEPDNPFADWLTGANLDAGETAEQLYAAALGEDTLVIYSTSTRMMDVAKSFEKAYPGLIVEVVHMREVELYDTLAGNYKTGNFTADLICSADGRGIMVSEFLPKGIAVKYVPFDIAPRILPGNNEELLMLAGEAGMLHYNDRHYSEPPVNNWWELTEEEWRGMVYLPNPTRSMTTLAFFCMVLKNSDMMARAFDDLYGAPPELLPGENAGHEFIRRLIANDARVLNSSDETAEAVGAPGSNSPNIGIIVSSKMRLVDIGYEIRTHYDMQPFAGTYTPINIMMAGGAPNVSAAKLFVRWLLGEADGQGEGYRPYLSSGAWSVRDDVRDESGVRTEELDLMYYDSVYLYENQEAFLAFWEELFAVK